MKLNYPGDVSGVVGQVAGPDLHGAIYEAVSAVYDPENDRSAVEWKPVLPDDPRTIVPDRLGYWWIRADPEDHAHEHSSADASLDDTPSAG